VLDGPALNGTVLDGQGPALPFGPELAALTDAMTTRPDAEPTAERQALVDAAGAEVAERAIGVFATFQMMNRLLDGVGSPISESHRPLAEALGFDPADIWG